MNEEIIIKQHYISRFLLKYFANDKNKVWECQVNNGKCYPIKYVESMVERFTYEHNKIKVNWVEKYFNQYEDVMGVAIQRMLNRINEFETKVANLNEVRQEIENNMKEFIIFYYRSGALLYEFEFELKNKEDRVLYLLDNIMNSEYIKNLSDTIKNYYDFAIIKSENHSFLMSDQYISTAALSAKLHLINGSNRNIGLKDVLILIPLSSKYYIAYFNGKKPDYINANCINSLTDSQILDINSVIINNAYIKCIAKFERDLKNSIDFYKFQSPSGVYASDENGFVMGSTRKKEIFFYDDDRKLWQFFTSMMWGKYINLGRNDYCACGSGKKFKKCCNDKFLGANRIYVNTTMSSLDNFIVSPYAQGEKGIGEFNIS